MEKKIEKKYIRIPTFGIIFFSLLLSATSFAAGVSWSRLKLNDSAPTSNTTNKIKVSDAKAVFSAEKTAKAEIKFFVMSFCPYGNQIETALRPVFDLLGKKANIQPQYIFNKISDLATYCKQSSGDPAQCKTYVENKYFPDEATCKSTIATSLAKCQDESSYIKATDGTLYSALHGRQEANQNVREICARNQSDDKTKWWNFVQNVNKNCTSQNADSCWSEQAKSAGFDTNKITECFNTSAISLIEKELVETEKYKAYSSPTLIINGVNFPPESAWTQDGQGNIAIGKAVYTQNQYRSPNTIKEALCASFKSAPGECKKVLPEVTTTTDTATGGGC